MNYKISDASIKQLRRFPYKERMIAEQIIKKEVKDWIDIVADTCIMGALIELIEDFHFGTNVHREDSQIKKFMAGFQEITDYAAQRYGDAMAEGLRKRLHDLGVEFERKGE